MGDLPTNRPAPAASGTLAKTPILHLLVYALEKRLGGTIELVAPLGVASDRRTASVLFVGGEPAKARIAVEDTYLGRVLVELGHLGEDELAVSLGELARAKAKGPALHGELLVRKGLIDPAKLESALREQLGRKLRHVASLPPETTYAYYDSFDGLRDWGAPAALSVDPFSLLWGLLRESTPRAHVDAALTRVAGSPLKLARGGDLARLSLGQGQRDAADLLRIRAMTTGEFARISGLDAEEARILVYLLLVTKQVDILSMNSVPPRASPAAMAPVHQAPSNAPANAASSPSNPGTHPAASPSPPNTIPSNPAPRSLTPPAAAVIAAAAAVAGARDSSKPPLRRSSTMPPNSQIPAALAAAARSRPPPAGLSPELSERWTTIVDRAKVIDRADYFAMLELARDATQEEVESAFFSLVKKWHPDRLPSELAPVRDACSRVFSRMTEAHATLTDEEQRGRYMKLLVDGSGSPEMQERVAKVLEAAADFQKAEVCFKRSDYGQAETLCRKAIKADPTQPDYHALLAWLVSLKPENQTSEKCLECVQMLDKALAMSDRCERGFFWRGLLNKRLGRQDAAIRDFRRVVDLNPRNIDAAREVRLHNMRGGRQTRSSSPPPGMPRPTPAPSKPPRADDKPGLLGRFFKK